MMGSVCEREREKGRDGERKLIRNLNVHMKKLVLEYIVTIEWSFIHSYDKKKSFCLFAGKSRIFLVLISNCHVNYRQNCVRQAPMGKPSIGCLIHVDFNHCI